MTLRCIVCTADIPQKRARRNAVTCSPECAERLNREKLQDRRKRKCAACGRRFRPEKQEGASLSQQTAIPVPIVHDENAPKLSAEISLSPDFLRNRFERVS
jgi:hypothetical protein